MLLTGHTRPGPAARFVQIKAVQFHFGDRHYAVKFKRGDAFKPVAGKPFGDLFAKRNHNGRITRGIFDLRNLKFVGSPIADLFGFVELCSGIEIRDVGKRMSAILVAGGNKLAGEIRIENSVQFCAQMMADPFRVEFRIVCDFYHERIG